MLLYTNRLVQAGKHSNNKEENRFFSLQVEHQETENVSLLMKNIDFIVN